MYVTLVIDSKMVFLGFVMGFLLTPVLCTAHREREIFYLDPPVEVEAVPISSDSILLSWYDPSQELGPFELPSDGRRYLVRYYQVPVGNNEVEFQTSQGTSALVENLIPDTVYEFRIQVVVRTHEGIVSEPVRASTEPSTKKERNGIKRECESEENEIRPVCEEGYVDCQIDPCRLDKILGGCDSYPKAMCKNNFCGGCYADWFYKGGKIECRFNSFKRLVQRNTF